MISLRKYKYNNDFCKKNLKKIDTCSSKITIFCFFRPKKSVIRDFLANFVRKNI